MYLLNTIIHKKEQKYIKIFLKIKKIIEGNSVKQGFSNIKYVT